MKKQMIIVAFLTAVAAANAQADDGAAWCQSYTENSGISDEPCACVIEAVSGDAALAQELYSFTNRDEYLANASDELKATLESCVGDV